MNVAIYRSATGQIIEFIRDAVQSRKCFIGSGRRIVMGSMEGLAIKWTNDDISELLDLNGIPVGWNKTAEELTEAMVDCDIGIIDRTDLLARLDNLRNMVRITNEQIDDRLTLVTNLEQAKVYLSVLTRETRDILRVALWLMNEKL